MSVDLHSIWSMTIDSGCGSSQVGEAQLTADAGTLMAHSACLTFFLILNYVRIILAA
jgi:hypothetical protein